MKRILLYIIFSVAGSVFLIGQTGVLSSQVGYDQGREMRVLICNDDKDFLEHGTEFTLNDFSGRPVFKGKLESWGNKWERYWWIADFSEFQGPGRYIFKIDNSGFSLRSDTITIGNSLLWNRCFHTIAFDNLNTRAEQARSGKGWKDCGSDLQEFSSHVVAIDALCDVLEIGIGFTSPDERKLLVEQIIRGSGYLAHLQDKADSLGLGDGSVIHEDRQTDVVTGNVAKAAMIFARVSRLIRQSDEVLASDYLKRAVKAFTWIEVNGPIVNPEEQIFFPHVHGAPLGSIPPKDQWMTRDLVMMLRASVELFRAGENGYKKKAIHYAEKIIKRQVPESESEDGLFGHFYTYDDYTQFRDIRFTEKANIHCGAWSKEGRIYNKGGHYPHYLIPMLDMIKIWPGHKDAKRWKKCVQNFAYGYFIPASRQSPFLILPAGYYHNEGLLYFSSWYHAHNKIYALAASLALEFQKFFNDDQFRPIAVGNIQWIAGLNVGLKDEETSKFLPVSMISGIGTRYSGSWTEIPGSICNGFSAGKQFRIAPALAENDVPVYFNDEDYIAHTIPYLAALARLKAYK